MAWLLSTGVTFAACGERLEEAERSVGFVLYGLRTVKNAVREAESETRGREAVYQNLRIHPPEEYDEALARQIGKIRRNRVRPKRALLVQLREQHEDARRQWERRIRLVHDRLREAEGARRENTLTEAAYCRAREVYAEALVRYQGGLEQYQTGLVLYAEALNAYREQFVIPVIRGYANPSLWQALVTRFEQDDFLQEFLNSLTASAIRSLPPEMPPDVS